MASCPVYQFYAELCNYKPKIWRRFQIMGNVTMARLGYVLMILFEMQASHLFKIDVPFDANHFRSLKNSGISEDILNKAFGGSEEAEKVATYRIKYFDDELWQREDGAVEAAETNMSQVVDKMGDELTMTYDFGDNWRVWCAVEEIARRPDLPGKELPRVLEGEGYGILEDCGGLDELKEAANALKKGKGPKYRELVAWLGRDDLDMSAFDLDDMNFRLKKLPRVYADIYEQDIEPTKRSLDILTRAYQIKKA